MAHTSPQPFLDDVIRQVELSILAGSALPIEDAALKPVITHLREKIARQLPGANLEKDRKRWFDDSVNVLVAAHALGVVATCVARLHHEEAVTQDSMDKAFTLVRAECKGEHGLEGCYCDDC